MDELASKRQAQVPAEVPVPSSSAGEQRRMHLIERVSGMQTGCDPPGVGRKGWGNVQALLRKMLSLAKCSAILVVLSLTWTQTGAAPGPANRPKAQWIWDGMPRAGSLFFMPPCLILWEGSTPKAKGTALRPADSVPLPPATTQLSISEISVWTPPQYGAPDSLKERDPVEIGVIVQNHGYRNSTAIVSLHDGHPCEGGAKIAEQKVAMPPLEPVELTFTWPAVSGSHALYAMIAPTGSASDVARPSLTHASVEVAPLGNITLSEIAGVQGRLLFLLPLLVASSLWAVAAFWATVRANDS